MALNLRFEDYTVAWICALEIELRAARLMLDEEHTGNFPAAYGDDNNYIGGRINGHNVVIASLPKHNIGNVSAAILAAQFKASFPNLLFGLIVGVGAGVPGRDLDPDIRLGDIVVGSPSDYSKMTQGVMGYDLGTESEDEFKPYATALANTGRLLRNTFLKIATEMPGRNPFAQFLAISIERRDIFSRPDKADNLYESQRSGSPPEYKLVPRRPRGTLEPFVHYGLIASGNKVVRNPIFRDALRDKYGVFCFEMEAAGIINTIDVGVIRGVCDYANNHKNKDWQPYAAVTAAAYAKKVLYSIGADQTKNPQSTLNQESINKEIIASFKQEARNPRQDTIPDRYRETYTWIWSSRADGGPGFREWLLEEYPTDDATKRGAFWTSGKPGAGKSTLMKYIYENDQTRELLAETDYQPPAIIAGYFFHELGTATEKTLTGLLHSVIYQICSQVSILAQFIIQQFERQKEMYPNSTSTIWTKLSLFKALKILVSQNLVQGTIFLFIDGLDECHEDADEGLEFLLGLIESTAPKKLRLRAYISSRPLTTIEDRLQSYPGFKIQEWTAPDILKYVQSQLNNALELACYTVDQSIVQQIEDAIIDQSMGVFIWVKLVVYEICLGIREGKTDNELLALLENLPEELQDLYSNIFEKITAKGYLEKALYYLQLISIGRHSREGPPTLLDLAFMDLEDRIDTSDFKDMKESEQTRLCQRTGQRLKTHLRSLMEASPLPPQHLLLEIPGNLGINVIHLTLLEYLNSSQTRMSVAFREKRSTALASSMSGYLRMLMNIEIMQPNFFMRLKSLDTRFPNETYYYIKGIGNGIATYEIPYCRLQQFFDIARTYELETTYTSTAFIENITNCLFQKLLDWKLELLNSRPGRSFESQLIMFRSLKWLGVDERADPLIIAIYQELNKCLEEEMQRTPIHSNSRPLLHIAITLGTSLNLYENRRELSETFRILFKYGWTAASKYQDFTAWAHLFIDPWIDPFTDIAVEFLKQGADPHLVIHEVTEHNAIDLFEGNLSWNQIREYKLNWFLPMHLWFRLLKSERNRMKARGYCNSLYYDWDEWKRELAKLFIEKGANPWLMDSRGETIIEVARDYDPQAAEFLQNLYIAHTGGNRPSNVASQPKHDRYHPCFRIDKSNVAEFRFEPEYGGYRNVLETEREKV